LENKGIISEATRKTVALNEIRIYFEEEKYSTWMI